VILGAVLPYGLLELGAGGSAMLYSCVVQIDQMETE
jgi:hypothetical protein